MVITCILEICFDTLRDIGVLSCGDIIGPPVFIFKINKYFPSGEVRGPVLNPANDLSYNNFSSPVFVFTR
jgi:hypothetical protein